jgi:hypothetical protein
MLLIRATDGTVSVHPVGKRIDIERKLAHTTSIVIP